MSWFNKKQNRETTLAVRSDGSIERQETLIVDGVVVDEDYFKDTWDNVWEYFYAHGATVGGNKWEKKYKNAYVKNGQVYDADRGTWEYTEAAGGNVNPFDMTATMESLFPRGASHGEYPEQYDGT